MNQGERYLLNKHVYSQINKDKQLLNNCARHKRRILSFPEKVDYDGEATPLHI